MIIARTRQGAPQDFIDTDPRPSPGPAHPPEWGYPPEPAYPPEPIYPPDPEYPPDSLNPSRTNSEGDPRVSEAS